MRTFRITGIATAFCVLCISRGAYAETGTGTLATGSGNVLTETGTVVRTTRDVTDAIRSLVPDRDPHLLKDLAIAENKRRSWENESTAARERLAKHRRDCREAIRAANRDQRMSRVLSCYRSDLLQDVNILRKQSQYVGAIPLLSPSVKAHATGAILALIDAQMAIVDAIDAGLFEREEGLLEARRNLRTTYREPYWLALTRLHADWELTYIIFMLKNIEERLADGADGARATLLHVAALCLESGTQTLLQARTSTDRLPASALLLQARDGLTSCRSTLKNIAHKERQAEAEKTTENSAQNEA